MAKKHANKKPKKTKKKPTMLETIEGLMAALHQRLEYSENAIKSLDSALSSYIDYKGDGNEWKDWVYKQIEKRKKEEDKKSDNKS
tara:strand:+ start:439 stop:693 length:255 start_codon:yes stop_codon:yes gene_type:complete